MNTEVKNYFSEAPESRATLLQTLHDAIVSCFPDATLDMGYKMPTYRHGDGWVAIANQKRYVSLYTCASMHIEPFKKKHPGYKTGKGCINFREKDDIPVQDVKNVIKHAMDHPKGV